MDVKPLAFAHCNTCRLTEAQFAHKPNVRDVLENIGQDATGVTVSLWGETSVTLDNELNDKDLLTITDAKSEGLKRQTEEEELKLRDAREDARRLDPSLVHWF